MATTSSPFAPGTPCWVDLSSSNLEQSISFYTSLFGWTAEDSGEEYGGYVSFSSDGHLVAGAAANAPGMGVPDCWTTYLAVADAEATVTLAVGAGAQVLVPAMPVAGLGSMAILTDPSGASFGIWQAGTHTGFRKYNEPGAVTWDELQTKNFGAAAAFYPEVFGWEITKTGDTDEFRYYTGLVGGKEVAGMMDAKAFLPPEVPSYWAVYFSVVDADAAAAEAVKLGGAITQPPMDTPYGRIGAITDPTGTALALHQAVSS